MDTRGPKSTWKTLIAFAIVCGVVVFAAGFLHRNAVVDAVAKQQARSAAVAKALTNDVAHVNLTKEAKGKDEKRLEKSVDPPAGTDLAIFSLDGERVYATVGARSVAGDRAAIASAAKGEVSHVVEGQDLVVYAPIPSDKKGQLAVGAVVTDYQKLLDDASGPLDAARLPLTAVGIVLFVVGLVLFARERKGVAPKALGAPKPEKAQKESKGFKLGRAAKEPKEPKAAKEPKVAKEAPAAKGRVSGFDPAPAGAVATATPTVAEGTEGSVAVEVRDLPAAETAEAAPKRFSLTRKPKAPTAATEEAEEAPSTKRSLFGRKQVAETPAAAVVAAPADDAALQREISIRQALEDQLEQLRTRMQTQEEQSSATIRGLREELEAAQAGLTPTPGPAEHDMIERVRTMESELAQARQAAAEATARVGAMERELSDAASSSVSGGAAELESQLLALQTQLEEAQRTATESEQRAQSTESVRSELEVRVAQLGSKAGELEQRAEQLEASLREANESGDAVRAEIATLSAALAAAESRTRELESAATSQGDAEAEISRLRSELGKQMERAQVAEERVQTLEADLAAAAHGVETLSDTTEAGADVYASVMERHEVEPEAMDEPELREPEPEAVREPAVEVRQPEPELREPEPEAVREPEIEAVHEPEVEAVHEPEVEAVHEPEVEAVHEPEVEAVHEPEVEAVHEPEPALVQAGSEPVQQWRPEPAAAERVEDDHQEHEEPPAPSDADRYDDVWAAAFPMQQNGSQHESVAVDQEPGTDATDDERASEPQVAVGSDAEAPEPEDGVSVEDDLWALRARLAHAGDADQPRETPPAPSWS